MKVTSILQAEKRYGPIVNGKWVNEIKFMIALPIPPSISPYLRNNATGSDTKRIYCNTDMAGPLIHAFNNLAQKGLLKELYTFDGCFCIRNVRGADFLSAHAYGLAIDLNAATNQLGKEPTLSVNFVDCFTSVGFTWGGNFKRKDGMHFSYCWE